MYTNDGAVRIPNPEDIVPGVVLRAVEGSEAQYSHSFSDSIVLKTWEGANNFGLGLTTMIKLARPYVFEHNGNALTGIEQYELSIIRCCKYYRLVLLGSGKPAKHSIG